MKQILFIINSLAAGGAERSLVSLLNSLPKENKYSIDLLLLKKGGAFYPMLPPHINVMEAEFPFNCLAYSPKKIRFYIKHPLKYWIKKIFRTIKCKSASKKFAIQQILWELWKKDITPLKKKYDVVIAYSEGFPNYFAIEKVEATKKILWIHSEYKKLKYNIDLDYQYFKRADRIVTISKGCKESLVESFPQIQNKIEVIENLSNPILIKKMAEEKITEINIEHNKFIIVSVGRLVPVKSFDLAIKAAKVLKNNRISFNWYIIGDGYLKERLKTLINQLELSNEVFLLGLQTNPYKFMKQADVIVQSSSYEGKSIVIDEAKILNKPIVSTNYTTVYDTIKNKETGIITEMSPEALASGINDLLTNIQLRNHLINNIASEKDEYYNHIQKYISLIELD